MLLYTFTIIVLANEFALSLPPYEHLLNKVGPIIDLARRCLDLSPFQPTSTLVISNKALSFIVCQGESPLSLPIGVPPHISLSVFSIYQNSQKVKILMYPIAKHYNLWSPNFLVWGFRYKFARTTYLINLRMNFLRIEIHKTPKVYLASSNGCISTGATEFLVPSYTPPCYMHARYSENYLSLNLTYILYTKFFQNSNFTHHTHASFLP